MKLFIKKALTLTLLSLVLISTNINSLPIIQNAFDTEFKDDLD